MCVGGGQEDEEGGGTLSFAGETGGLVAGGVAGVGVGCWR